jgi:glycosyltransferase involved in cell wall biosynthesis
VRRTAPGDLLSDADRAEAARTIALQPVGPGRLLRSHLRALRLAPRAYVRTLAAALREAPAGARDRLWQLFYFAEAAVLAIDCRDAGIRHLHVHFANFACDVAMLATALGVGPSTWSFTMHGPSELFDVRRARLALKTERARFVVCISDFARSQLMRLVAPSEWEKLSVIHCGVDAAVYGAVERPERETVRIVCVGRLVPDKGQAVLLEAVAELAREGLAVELELIGDGEDRGRLEAIASRLGIADRVRFAGAVAQDRTAEHYARADVFCLPSFAEGVPVVLMEAMATAMPVISTRIAGIAELVEDGVSGFLVAPGRADELAAAIRRLAGDPGLRARMGAEGRRKVEADFALDRSAGALAELFARQVP